LVFGQVAINGGDCLRTVAAVYTHLDGREPRVGQAPGFWQRLFGPLKGPSVGAIQDSSRADTLPDEPAAVLADQRKAFVDRVIKQAKEFLAEGEALVSMIDILIKDIDQCNFSMKNSIECLKLLAESKGSKVV
jgi:hypothetical protein